MGPMPEEKVGFICYCVAASSIESLAFCVVQPVPEELDRAKAWVLATGSLAAVDPVFTDWFGHKSSDLNGVPLSSVMLDIKVLDM